MAVGDGFVDRGVDFFGSDQLDGADAECAAGGDDQGDGRRGGGVRQVKDHVEVGAAERIIERLQRPALLLGQIVKDLPARGAALFQ